MFLPQNRDSFAQQGKIRIKPQGPLRQRHWSAKEGGLSDLWRIHAHESLQGVKYANANIEKN